MSVTTAGTLALPRSGSALIGPLRPSPLKAVVWTGGRRGQPKATEQRKLLGLIREQFILREGLILLNAANLCPSPLSAMEAVFGHLRDKDRDASFQNRAKFDNLRETSRTQLAQLLGASPDEIAIVRNTSVW